MPDRIPVSREGYEKLGRELEELRSRRPALQKAMGEARAKGDLSENAEYHAAKEALSHLDGRIRELSAKLQRVEIIEGARAPQGQAAFGSRVRLLELAGHSEEEYTLVGEGEADFSAGKILTTSPLGRALLGRKPGEEFELRAPRGAVRYRVLEVS